MCNLNVFKYFAVNFSTQIYRIYFLISSFSTGLLISICGSFSEFLLCPKNIPLRSITSSSLAISPSNRPPARISMDFASTFPVTFPLIITFCANTSPVITPVFPTFTVFLE